MAEGDIIISTPYYGTKFDNKTKCLSGVKLMDILGKKPKLAIFLSDKLMSIE